jgi:hypothetical protein
MATQNIGRSFLQNFRHDYLTRFEASYDVTRTDLDTVDFTGQVIVMDVYDEDFETILWTATSTLSEIIIDVDNLTFDKVLDLDRGTYPYRCYVDVEEQGINHGYITIN